VKHIHYHERSAIEQNNVAADHDMLAIRRRRRKMPLQVARTNHNLRSQTRRQRAANHQLALQSRWQPIALGQARRQMVMVLAVAASHLVAVVIGIRMSVVVFIVVFIVAFSVTVPMIVVIVPIVFVVTLSVILRYG
jgi:hypothetical protein